MGVRFRTKGRKMSVSRHSEAQITAASKQSAGRTNCGRRGTGTGRFETSDSCHCLPQPGKRPKVVARPSISCACESYKELLDDPTIAFHPEAPAQTGPCRRCVRHRERHSSVVRWRTHRLAPSWQLLMSKRTVRYTSIPTTRIRRCFEAKSQ
jgi:hypothetical protein